MFRPHAVSIAILTAMLTVSSANAQQHPSSSIESFRGFAWGIDAQAVMDALGEPEQDTILDGGLRMLAFRDSLVGRPSVMLFGVLPEDGLVKGEELITALEGQKCIDQIRKIHNSVDLQYPLIRPTEEARNNTAGLICEAAKRGQGFWHRQWIDESTGSVISVRLDSGSRQVSLIFESLQFRVWVGAPIDVVPDVSEAAEDAIGPSP
jgi:hypothetical protein